MHNLKLNLTNLYTIIFLFTASIVFPNNAAPLTEDENTSVERISYDQRQTGKYNIHVSIKDVAIIEIGNDVMDETLTEEDYYYDEGDLTVKPGLLNPTSTPISITKSTTTSTSTKPTRKPTAETTSAASVNSTTSTIIQPTVDSNNSGNLTSSTIIPPTIDSNNSNVTNIVYSRNLLADIAATRAEYFNTTSTPSLAKRTPNVVILDDTSKQHNSPTSTHKPRATIKTSGRSKYVPGVLSTDSLAEKPFNDNNLQIQKTDVPTSKHDQTQGTQTSQQSSISEDYSDTLDHDDHDSKIFTFKVRRPSKQIGTRKGLSMSGMRRTFCRSNQYRDTSGNCRAKRSSSILKKLFSMLASLPFASEKKNLDTA
ncbi:uncharacterized protein LOC119687003 [Teleopsis dalmanni]|uniref:uncharacterized protein LOC119687003 n=1 Tax=Teleopsis dalmanni TaxID=139649 RepID=UPI0018CD6059|nr:uncharacterized protein LOC119687003 [Teleopsis dalmanni]